MNNSVRNTLGIIVGVIIGGAINGGIVVISPMIIPPPGGVDMSSVQGMSAGIHLLVPLNFIAPFLARALGTFAGAFEEYPSRLQTRPTAQRVVQINGQYMRCTTS